MPATSVIFSNTARLLAAEARRRGLAAPGFRSPPRSEGVDRSIRLWPGGGAVIAVRLRGRPFAEVVDDMVEGVLVSNAVTDAGLRDRLRHELLAAVAEVAGMADGQAA